MATTPYDALRRLRELAASGQIAALCARHNITLLVVHGSVLDAQPQRPARDLDLAFQVRRGAESGLFARAQMAALTTAMETRRLRRLDLELLAG